MLTKPKQINVEYLTNMNKEQILEIIRCGENSRVQFKEHFTTQKQMAEELVAMANAKGVNLMDLYPDLTERCPKLPKTERNNARVVLHLCEQPKSVVELMEATGYESRTSFRRKILTPLLEAGLLKPVLGDKNSPKQRYILQDSALMS